MSFNACRVMVSSIAFLGFTFAPVAKAEQAGTPGYLPIALESGASASVVVDKGDHLWSISADELALRLTRRPSAAEIAPYWREVIDVNRDRLRSGDPDLIFPGETVILPDAG